MENLVLDIKHLRIENKEQKSLMGDLNMEAVEMVCLCETITNDNLRKYQVMSKFCIMAERYIYTLKVRQGAGMLANAIIESCGKHAGLFDQRSN